MDSRPAHAQTLPVTDGDHLRFDPGVALFGGLPLVPPGVVPVTQWRPTVPISPAATGADLYAGMARTSPHSCASTTRLGVVIG